MHYAQRLLFILCLCVGTHIALAYAKQELELTYAKRDKTMTNQNQSHEQQSDWIAYINKFENQKSLSVKDKSGRPLVLELKVLSTKSSDPSTTLPTSLQLCRTGRMNTTMLSLADLAAMAFTSVELEYLQHHPEAMANEPLYKEPLALFTKDTKIDWYAVNAKVYEIIHNLYAKTDWSKFETEDAYIVAMIKNESKILIGYVTFFVRPSYKFGECKVIAMGVAPEYQNRGIGKLLMSSIFNIIPKVEHIFLTTRITNTKALNAYHSWGFQQNPNPVEEPGHVFNPKYWIFLDYNAQKENGLQKLAETLS